MTHNGTTADPAAAPAAPTSALVQLLKQHADALTLDAFAWRLFEQWLSMSAVSKDKWALGTVGHFGGDASVLKLTPLVREWPGEGQHQRAVLGLEVMRAIGTDSALLSLSAIARKLKFKGLKEKAEVMMEDIARARGLTREQLADRIVPDCGLDARGGRVFDFGPRQFWLVLGAGMKPLLRDAAGNIKPGLPPPGKADNADLAAAAVADWKLLKQTLQEVAKLQTERLEDAMISGRRWTPREFETLLLRHPLMMNLARQLLFGVYDTTGTLGSSFRVTEDQSLADSGDNPFDLPGSGLIGVVHPAHLDEPAKSAWGQILSDYTIIPPFPQLDREICHAEPGELNLTEITRFKGPQIPDAVLSSILHRAHWVRDKALRPGDISAQRLKYFPAANVTAFIRSTCASIGYNVEDQEIETVFFVAGFMAPDGRSTSAPKLPIKDVDPVALSEVMRFVRAIMAKAES